MSGLVILVEAASKITRRARRREDPTGTPVIFHSSVCT